MFRLIGIIVVVSVLVIGYTSLNKWYEGKATPAETVVNLRDQFGAAIKSNSHEKELSANESQPEKNEKSSTSNESNTGSAEFSTENAARELIKHANE